MDIQIASNFERYLYFLTGEDPGAVRALIGEMERSGRLVVADDQRTRVARDFDALAVSDEETLDEIRAVYAEDGYILCPHSAIGVRAAGGRPDTLCLATAHPAKFNEAVTRAIGREAPPPPSLRGLMEKETRCVELDASAEAVRAHIRDTLTQPGRQ